MNIMRISQFRRNAGDVIDLVRRHEYVTVLGRGGLALRVRQCELLLDTYPRMSWSEMARMSIARWKVWLDEHSGARVTVDCAPELTIERMEDQ